MNKKNILNLFRAIAMLEGISFLFLLLIAMPLKYKYNFPQAVRVGGMIHGLLFVSFIMTAWNIMTRLNKTYKWFFICFLLSIIPFGTFYLDKQLRKEI